MFGDDECPNSLVRQKESAQREEEEERYVEEREDRQELRGRRGRPPLPLSKKALGLSGRWV